MKLNENTNIALPIRNLLAIVGAVAIGVWAYFGVIERLNQLETKNKLLLKTRKEVDINKNGSGYTVKEGSNKGKTLAHIQIAAKNL